MGRFSPGELLLIALIILLLFGAGRLSDIGKGLADGIKNFKKGLKDDDNDKQPPQLGGTDIKSGDTKSSEIKA